jgi:uncharacterized protein YndB with AHSA1/START domain
VPTYHARRDIAAPIELVYARVADLTGHPDWSSDPLTVEQRSEDEFSSTARSKGKEIAATLRVIEREPPKRFAFEVTDLTGKWVNRFTLIPIEKGTRVEREISGELGGAQLLLFWLVLYPIKKPNARRSLVKLADLLERS